MRIWPLFATEPDNELRDPDDGKPLWYDSNKAELLEAHQPGGVLFKSFNPIQLLAIVHDLDQTPSWQSIWIEMALDKILVISNTKELSSISIPVLGTQFGRFKLEEFISTLGQLLKKE